ncbi:DUF1776-domain-containing protein [Eremomyces bilateralis CBS 781.70]|uniref:DUF1776-domain-containing protein n=1 Tax=Eremomyces bilateralis CBS 781.70 TaxID=1392243 RepID=A0A6G1G212_9PEZI|nr:DUF1776-domain-containing protein [Eremomyces bilateralis CBS 781.70]KAF1812147.1 DUF1776-domain-containing protein [Eremomyces bilateralis CBS 781.70]
MTSDDRQFLDLLAHISDQVAKFTTTAAEHFDASVDTAAASIRHAIDSLQPPPPPPPPPPRVATSFLTHGPLGRVFGPVTRWCERHVLAAWTIGTFVGVGGMAAGVQWWRYQGARRVGKMRAKRGERGERVEVVVVGGGWSGLVRSVALSLERRGYIVFVMVETREEEEAVGREGREGLRAMWFEPSNADRCLENLRSTLSKDAISSDTAHSRTLTAAILIPPLPTSITATETLPPSTWTTALSALHATITTTQSLIPLLRTSHARLLLLTPNAVSALHPPRHAQESTLLSALAGFVASLRHELAHDGVPVTHLRTGSIDHHTSGSAEDDPDDPRRGRGEPGAVRRNQEAFMRINRAVVGALTTRWAGGTVRVGMGAWGYDLVERWVPEGVVGWMMGRKRRGKRRVERGLLEFGEGSWHQV